MENFNHSPNYTKPSIEDTLNNLNSRILKRWRAASESCNWITKEDQGYHRTAKLSDEFRYFVTDPNKTIFGIDEVEWCSRYCTHGFTRRYSTSHKLEEKSCKNLNVMAFKNKKDSMVFTVFVNFLYFSFPRNNDIMTTSVGTVYYLSGSFDFINNNYFPDQKTLDATTKLRNWCAQNCEGQYLFSTYTFRKFLWFEKESDAVYFKLSVLPLGDSES